MRPTRPASINATPRHLRGAPNSGPGPAPAPKGFGRNLRNRAWGTGAESDGSGERIISTMRASGPTTRPAHALSHFIETYFYAATPGLIFPGGCDPAYPLIACQWRDARPHVCDDCVGLDRVAKICRHPVYRTGRNRLSSHGSRSLQVNAKKAVRHGASPSGNRRRGQIGHSGHRHCAAVNAVLKGVWGVLSADCTIST